MSIVHSSVTSEQRWASLVFLFIAMAMFFGTVYLTFDAWNLSQNDHTIGRIVALDVKNRPTVQFQTRSGKHVTFQDGTSSPFLIYEVGNDVEVVYRAEHPQDAQIAGNQWAFPILLGILTLGCGLFGVAAIRGRAVVGPLRQRRSSISVE